MKKGDTGYFQAIIDQAQYGLTFEQQVFVQKNADKLQLAELVQKTFKEPSLNERSVEYDDMRKYVAKMRRAVDKLDFTLDQILFIEANALTMKPFELAKNIFPDKDLKPLSREPQAITEYLKAIGAVGSDGKETDQYKPPKASASLVRKINQADTNANFDPNDLSPFQKKCVEGLKSWLQSSRFRGFMDIYREFNMHEMYEEEFIKATYDKPDLNTEELNMYVTLCSEYVNIHTAQKSVTSLESKIDSALSSDDAKLFQSWVDLLETRRKDLDNSKKMAKDLQVKLSDSRSNRLKGMAQINESLSKFVEEWKSEEGRKRALKVAEARNKQVHDEIVRLETMDEYIANVFGVGRDEILRN